ncbi:MmgE/PrpD family protein [Natronorubrum texcoconense]|uniref:2-methylcitrate dehydratase PrpD n=1 Tax=Natronorubrum texcoconense TaxID=1095776 RepID=A0A1G9D1X5_9EURY|nr:MmgE/PrpD family protein [Natronorubrum texcoconense]SDK57946.1 2-methylcitrate dehydratase PrpD [Natronorubrum texcoconense]
MTTDGPTPTTDWEAAIFDFLEAPIPDAVLDYGAKTVTDVLGATVAGSAVEPYARAWDTVDVPSGSATVIGTDRTTNPVQAATLNGTVAIVQEVEEGHNTGGHVGSGIVAGGLAMAEHADADGETLVESCVRAYELCTRLEEAIFAMKARINEAVPWLVRDPHATWTTVGPAVAAILCTDPEPETVRETFRLAANRAVVSMEDPYEEGPPSRNVTAGASAGVGITMAQLAQAGIPGSGAVMQTVYDPFEDILPDGFTSLFADLGSEWAIAQNYFKPYPSCRYTHAPVDALQEIDGEIRPEEVERIVVDTYANAADMAHTTPETLTGAKFSIPYVLARTIHSGTPTLEDFEPDAIADSAVQALANSVVVRASEGFDAAFPDDWGARVTVEFTDGSSKSGERPYPRGDYRDPLSDEEFDDRLESLLAYGLPAGSRETAVDVVRSPREYRAREIGSALRMDS